MQTIPVEMPFVHDGKQVSEIVVTDINFVTFTDVVKKASVGEGSFDVRLARERLITQCSLRLSDDRMIKLDGLLVSILPIKLAHKLLPLVSMYTGTPGEILTPDADGITSPILYKLGTPFAIGRSATNGVENDIKDIPEIEFFAKTYGEIEEVIAADSPAEQTLALLRKVAKPLDMMSMPSWMVEQVSVMDGIFLMNKVLPRFLP